MSDSLISESEMHVFTQIGYMVLALFFFIDQLAAFASLVSILGLVNIVTQINDKKPGLVSVLNIFLDSTALKVNLFGKC